MNRLVDQSIGRLAAIINPAIDRLANHRFYNFPFGDKPWADAETYKKIWEAARQIEYPLIDQYEQETGYAIDADWFHQLALLTQVVIKKSDICYQHGRLLYSTLSQYIHQNRDRPITILETGTARGFSALCMAKALQDRRSAGKVITYDVLPHQEKMCWNCIADAKGPQTRAELLKDYRPLIESYIFFHQGDTQIELPKIEIPRVHFAFLDGMHTYEYAMHEFDYVTSRQNSGDIIFFDDYTPQFFPGIVKAVDEICENHAYKKRVVRISEQRGYAITSKM